MITWTGWCKYKDIYTLLNELKKDNNCLDGLSYKIDNDKIRKVNKTAIENLKKYLL